jgi:hypothetical protein
MLQPGGGLRAEEQRIKNCLDAVIVKAVAALHLCVHAGNSAVYEGEALAHIPDVFPVLRRHTRWNHTAVKAQLHSCVVVVGGAGEQGTDQHDD